jgi:hypothetical protein
MTEQKPQSKSKRRFEPWIVVTFVGACAIIVMLVFIYAFRCQDVVLIIISQPILVALLGLFVVSVSRWLEGPLRVRQKRRSQASHSRAVSAVFLWLACFAALETAFLISAWSFASLSSTPLAPNANCDLNGSATEPAGTPDGKTAEPTESEAFDASTKDKGIKLKPPKGPAQ